jgi:PAS domain S-box-containing protein
MLNRTLADEVLDGDERFLLVADSAPVMIWMSGRDMRCTFFNKRWLEFTGRTMEHELGNGWTEGVHPADLQYCLDTYVSSFNAREPFSMEYRLRRADGEYRWILDNGGPRYDREGQFAGYIGSAVDITERKRADLELRAALAENERLRQRLEAENVYLQAEVGSTHNVSEIVGRSQALRAVLHKAAQVAATDAPVLLLGETGTGKELIAHALHAGSGRRARPLIAVNCAALPPSLIESELFGHEKGAFTGATQARPGRFELANGSTLFLDEIGDLDLPLQAKLLRALQEGEIQRLGSSRTHKFDVRIIAATNRDLEVVMHDGRFRADLYYRLAVFPIALPPLRERRDDIPLLVWHIIQSRQRALGRAITQIPQPAMDALVAYAWPGNVRELQNVIERALILSTGPQLQLDEAFGRRPTVARAQAEQTVESLPDAERAHILAVLERCAWIIEGANQAAARLGLRPSTLRNRMRKLGIRRP